MINQITSTALRHQDTSQPSRSDVSGAVSEKNIQPTTTFSPQSGLKIVNDNVIDSIDKELAKTDAKSVRELDANDFTPESVAKGILGFVQDAISRARARGQSTDGMLEQAKIGIENGFTEAKNILTSLNALSGQIAEGVQQTYNLIQNGLQQLEAAGNNFDAVKFDTEVTQAAQVVKSSSQSFELSLKTQDGDDIKISVSQSHSFQGYSASISKGNETTSLSGFDSISSGNFELQVSGNLDKAEVKAIEELLSDVKNISDKFFDGNTSAAFEAGLSLGFNTQEIASVALELNESQTVAASRAYREVSGFGDGSQGISTAQLESIARPAHDFMALLQDSIDKTSNNDLLKATSPQSVGDLFNYFSREDSNHTAQLNKLEALAGTPFENITSQLLSALN